MPVLAVVLGVVLLGGAPYTRVEARQEETGWQLEAETVRGVERLTHDFDEILAEIRAAAG